MENEARTRVKLIDPQIEKAQWNLKDRTQVGIEIPVDGYDAEFLPEKGAILDRLEAMDCYTAENTRLLCPSCDQKIQKERGYQ